MVEDGLKCRITETAIFPSLYVVFKSETEPLRSKIESVPKWFVNTTERITTGHENLACRQRTKGIFLDISKQLALSKAVEQARGCVATNIGLVDMLAVKTQ